MGNQFLSRRLTILLVLFTVTGVVWYPSGAVSHQTDETLTVRFLDVGQGDAIHVETPDGYELLIDGGPTASVLRELSSSRSFFDRSIDVVIATHPDTDHIAGLVDVLRRYDIGVIMETHATSNVQSAQAYMTASRGEGATIVQAKAGQVLQLGDKTTVHILSPHEDIIYSQNNNASVIIRIDFGDVSIMLTGDAPSTIEEYLVRTHGSTLQSSVLKLGHHGSKTSSSDLFMDSVSPTYAVVSAGADNRYGHPHPEVVERVRERGIKLVSTADLGTVTFVSDGKSIWLE